MTKIRSGDGSGYGWGDSGPETPDTRANPGYLLLVFVVACVVGYLMGKGG